jgi:hypothetical protein
MASPTVYRGREDSLGVSFRAQGCSDVFKSLHTWQMKSVYKQPGPRQTKIEGSVRSVKLLLSRKLKSAIPKHVYTVPTPDVSILGQLRHAFRW